MEQNTIVHIPLELLDADPEQPRTKEDGGESSLSDMAASIRVEGVIQPILVVQEGERYRIVAGHRRVAASKMAEQRTVPAIVRQPVDREDRLSVQLIENIQRQRLMPRDLVSAIYRLHTEFNLSVTDIGKKVGKSKAWVSRILAVAKDEGLARKALDNGMFMDIEGAYRFRGLDIQYQQALYNKAKATGETISRTEVERLVSASMPQPEDSSPSRPAAIHPVGEIPREVVFSPIAPSRSPEQEGGGENETEPVDRPSSLQLAVSDPESFEDFNQGLAVYKDYGTTWVIRITEMKLKSFLEHSGIPAGTEQELVDGVLRLIGDGS